MPENIAALIPHAGAMCLLDGVLSWDSEKILCIATSHRLPANPLAKNGALPVVCGLEYAAQAMAAHGALTGLVGARPRAGYIASVRDLTWQTDRLDTVPDPLHIEAERLAGDGRAVSYSFRVSAQKRVLLAGRAAVLLEVDV